MSLNDFCQLVADLGIVGRVRFPDEEEGIIETDFSFAIGQIRLTLVPNNNCAIHPMFFHKLNIKVKEEQICIYPFPATEEYFCVRELYYKKGNL